jgi:hypothetical protein
MVCHIRITLVVERNVVYTSFTANHEAVNKLILIMYGSDCSFYCACMCMYVYVCVCLMRKRKCVKSCNERACFLPALCYHIIWINKDEEEKKKKKKKKEHTSYVLSALLQPSEISNCN